MTDGREGRRDKSYSITAYIDNLSLSEGVRGGETLLDGGKDGPRKGTLDEMYKCRIIFRILGRHIYKNREENNEVYKLYP